MRLLLTIPDLLEGLPLSTSLRHLFLPSATVVAERLCFHRCLSVYEGAGVGRHPLAGRYPQQADTPPEMATAADGMHPTGMHSCGENIRSDLLLLLSD